MIPSRSVAKGSYGGVHPKHIHVNTGMVLLLLRSQSSTSTKGIRSCPEVTCLLRYMGLPFLLWSAVCPRAGLATTYVTPPRSPRFTSSRGGIQPYDGGMNHSLIPSSALEAEPCPLRHHGLPSDSRPAEEQEAAIVAHQARIDAARDRGLLLDPEERQELRYSASYQPGFQNTPRGIRLGAGVGYRTSVNCAHGGL